VVKVVPMKYNDPEKDHCEFSSFVNGFSRTTAGEGEVVLYVFLSSSSYSRICLLIYFVYCCTSVVCLLSIIFDKRRSLSRSRFFNKIFGIAVVVVVASVTVSVAEEDEEVDRESSDSIS